MTETAAPKEKEQRITARERRKQIKQELGRGATDEQVEEAYVAERLAEKKARFQEVAPRRVNALAKAMTNLGRCASTATYSYEAEEVEKILDYIDEEYRKLIASFAPQAGSTEDKGFTLGD